VRRPVRHGDRRQRIGASVQRLAAFLDGDPLCARCESRCGRLEEAQTSAATLTFRHAPRRLVR